MATNNNNVLVGAGVLSLGVYQPAGGAATLVDAGHSRNLALAVAHENFDVKTDRAYGLIKKIPIETSYRITGILDESTPENWRLLLRLATGNLTGTPPNQTLDLGDPKEVYYQTKLDIPGIGTNKTRAIVFYKGFSDLSGDIPFQKAAVQNLPFTIDCLYDDSVTGANKFGKLTDS